MAETLLQKAKRLGIQPAGSPVAGQPNQADIASAERFKPTFPSTSDESVLEGAAKVVGNIPSSAFNFGKNLVDFFNPVNIARDIKEIGESLPDAKREGVGISDVLREVPKEAVKTLVPTFLQNLFSGDTEEARRTIENDPVGQILPILTLARSAAQKAGKVAEFDAGISKVASPPTKSVEAVAGGAKALASRTTKFGVSQATGLAPETLSQILENPEAFTRQARATVSRKGIAQTVEGALSERQATLSETGAAYKPIRDSGSIVPVPANYLETTLKKIAGVDVIDGKVTARSTSSVRNPSDVRALQNLYDFWKPTFTKGQIRADEFLNLRADLSELSKFERTIGKSDPLEAAAQRIRGELNTSFRNKIKGLEKLDEDFAGQISEFGELRKGLIDREGNLTDPAINRIANATGKGKDRLIERLEEINPGITERIKILKAVEDIEVASGNKVGTYTRAGGALVGVATFNPYLIVGAILTIPEVAVPILRGIGMATPKIQNTLRLLNVPFKALNELPGRLPSDLPASKK